MPILERSILTIPLRTRVGSSCGEVFGIRMSDCLIPPVMFVWRIVGCFLVQLATVHVFLPGHSFTAWLEDKKPKQRCFDFKNWIRSGYGRRLRASQASRACPELQKEHKTCSVGGVDPESGASGDGLWTLSTCAARLVLLLPDLFCLSFCSFLGFVSSVIFPNTGLEATLASLSTNSARSLNVTDRLSVSMIWSTERRHVFRKLNGNFMTSFCMVSGCSSLVRYLLHSIAFLHLMRKMENLSREVLSSALTSGQFNDLFS